MSSSPSLTSLTPRAALVASLLFPAAPTSLQSEYGPAYPRALARSGQLLDLVSRDVSLLLPALESAVRVAWPPHRCLLGADATLFALAATFLPSRLCDVAALLVLGWPRPASLTARASSQAQPSSDRAADQTATNSTSGAATKCD